MTCRRLELTSGYLMAVAAAAAIATAFVSRKYISTQVNTATFSVWWYGLAGLYAWLLAWGQHQAGHLDQVRRSLKPLIVMVLCNAVAAILYFTEIDLTNPALVAFLGRLRTVYTVLLSLLFLRERFNRLEWLGAGIAILGALTIAYRGDAALNLVFWIALVENLLMAVTTIAAKLVLGHLPPLALAGYRGLSVSLLILIYALITHQWQWIDASTLAWIAGGAFISPFLGYVFQYGALARIQTSQVAVILDMQPVFATLYTALLFHTWPTARQSVGGLLVIGGVLLILAPKHKEHQHA